MDINVEHDRRGGRFRVITDDHESFLDYREIDEDTLELYHTYVTTSLRSQGIAAKIVETALVYAQDNRLKVLPTCSYVRNYIDRHPQFQDLLR